MDSFFGMVPRAEGKVGKPQAAACSIYVIKNWEWVHASFSFVNDHASSGKSSFFLTSRVLALDSGESWGSAIRSTDEGIRGLGIWSYFCIL